MVRHRLLFVAAFLAAAPAFAPVPTASALEECRLLRQPDIQGETIVFCYAADLWVVARGGGVARRLTSHEGIERFPKLSPDGKTVAFTAEYDGNYDAFTVPVEGGEPVRLTWHPDLDQVAEWYPDGKSILLRSRRASFIQRFDRFFRIPAAGGFEEMLSLPTGGYATFSPDGRQDRVRFALVRQPHVEALQGRQRSRDLDLRLRRQPLREDHRLGGRRMADVARPHRVLLLGPRRPHREPVGL